MTACVFGLGLRMLCAHPLVTPLSSNGALSIGRITPDRTEVGRYEKIELTFDLSGSWDNPFDPSQIDVWADFTSPSGRQISLPAFFYQGYNQSRGKDGLSELLERDGPPVWKARFAPSEVGEYTVRIRARNSSQSATSGMLVFRCVESHKRGFIRVSPSKRRYFEFADGSLFFAIGENICWPGPTKPYGYSGGSYDYELWCKRLAEAGGNCMRIWFRPAWPHCLEIYEKWRTDAGPGRYKQDNAWRIDRILQICEGLDVRVMMCLDSFNLLRRTDPYPAWKMQSYAADNGGWIKEPREFFTDKRARELTRQKLRYVVARWGYSTSVWCWELWNEVNIIEQFESENVAAWHKEMALAIRQIDPFGHPVTTSYAGTSGDKNIDSLPEMEFVQSHDYGAKDFADVVRKVQEWKWDAYGKPHLFGEFGVGYSHENAFGKNHREADPDGLAMHEVAWASVSCGCAGSGMVWYWNDYVDPLNLYGVLTPAAKFVRDLPLNRIDLKPLQVESFLWESRANSKPILAVDVPPAATSWKPSPQNRPNLFSLERDGTLRDRDLLTGIFHGLRNHLDKHNPATIRVDYPKPGRFTITVRQVSEWGGANLHLRLDHRTVLFKDFPDDGSRSLTRKGPYDCYAGEYTIAVPAGQHLIGIENTGADWFTIRRYLFESEFETQGPNLRVTGLQGDDLVIGWIQNPVHNWFDRMAGNLPVEQPPGRLVLTGLRDGQWLLRWYDTYSGTWLAEERINCEGGKASFATPPVAKDIAFRLDRIR